MVFFNGKDCFENVGAVLVVLKLIFVFGDVVNFKNVVMVMLFVKVFVILGFVSIVVFFLLVIILIVFC